MGIQIDDNLYMTENEIAWDFNNVIEILTPIKPGAPLFRNLPIAGNISYDNDKWDFNAFNKLNKNKNIYIFHFSKIHPLFINFLKNIVLRELFLVENRPSTTSGVFSTLSTFIKYLSNNNITHIELIDDDVINSFFKEHETTCSQYRNRYKKDIELLFSEISRNNPHINYSNIFSALRISDSERKAASAEKNNNGFEYIPHNCLQKIVSVAVKDINYRLCQLDNGIILSESEISDAMSSCIVVILSEVGMRAGEFHKIKVNKLIPLKPKSATNSVYYLEFITYKTTPERDGRLTQTYMSDIAIHAYNAIIKFTNTRRQKTGSEYIFINQKGNLYSSEHNVTSFVRRFFVRNQREIDFENFTLAELGHFRSTTVSDKFRDKLAEKAGDVGTSYYYVASHQFRVTCATELYRLGKHLDWIVIHMNHMSDTMTQHYIRIAELEKNNTQRIAKGIMAQASDDGKSLLINMDKTQEIQDGGEKTRDLKQIYEGMQQFISKIEMQNGRHYNLKVYKDVREIINIALRNDAFITEVTLGFCVNSFFRICSNYEYISSARNQTNDVIPYIHDIHALEFNYHRFKEKVKIIKYNKCLVKARKDLRNEYQKELLSLNMFAEKILLPELDLLKQDIKNYGIDYVIDTCPGIESIIKSMDRIKDEVEKWKKRV